MAGNQSAAGRKMTPGRAPRGYDPARVNPLPPCIPPDPAEGRLGIRHRFKGGSLMPAAHPVIRTIGNHSARCEPGGLGMELPGRSAHPAAAEEKDNGGPLVIGLPPRWSEDLELELGLFGLSVGHHLIRVPDFRLGSSQSNRTGSQKRNGQERAHVAFSPHHPRRSEKKMSLPPWPPPHISESPA